MKNRHVIFEVVQFKNVILWSNQKEKHTEKGRVKNIITLMAFPHPIPSHQALINGLMMFFEMHI